jgi:prevent-host-death family protein
LPIRYVFCGVPWVGATILLTLPVMAPGAVIQITGSGMLICLDRSRQIAVTFMTSPDADHWQIQDAKQRFSEMIRAVTSEGPQVITRHGKDVAVVVDIGEYRRLTRPAVDLTGVLLGGPKLDDATDVFGEVEAERKADFGRAFDLEADG